MNLEKMVQSYQVQNIPYYEEVDEMPTYSEPEFPETCIPEQDGFFMKKNSKLTNSNLKKILFYEYDADWDYDYGSGVGGGYWGDWDSDFDYDVKSKNFFTTYSC